MPSSRNRTPRTIELALRSRHARRADDRGAGRRDLAGLVRARGRVRGARRRDALPLRPLHLAGRRGPQRRARRLDDDRRARGTDDDAPLRHARLPRHVPRCRRCSRTPPRPPTTSRAGGSSSGSAPAGMEREHRAYGFPFPETRMRVAMFAEQLEIVHRLWTEERVDFRGRALHARGRARAAEARAAAAPAAARRRQRRARHRRAGARASPTSTTRRSSRPKSRGDAIRGEDRGRCASRS